MTNKIFSPKVLDDLPMDMIAPDTAKQLFELDDLERAIRIARHTSQTDIRSYLAGRLPMVMPVDGGDNGNI